MDKRNKLWFSLATLCVTIAVLVFGVYSATSVNYSLGGSISYEVNDVFVNINTSLYLSNSTELTSGDLLDDSVGSIDSALSQGTFDSNLSTLGVVKSIVFQDNIYNSYTPEGGFDDSANPGVQNIPLNYGPFVQDTEAKEEKSFAYYIVIKIQNNGSNVIHAILDLGDTSTYNSNISTNKTRVEMQGKETAYYVIGMSLNNPTDPITDISFSYTIQLNNGALPVLRLSDYQFQLNADKTASLLSYGGMNTVVDVPEKVGVAKLNNYILKISNGEGLFNMTLSALFQQDLKMTLPEDSDAVYKGQPLKGSNTIKNPLFLDEQIITDIASGSLNSDDYFPMTIETPDSYDIDETDIDFFTNEENQLEIGELMQIFQVHFLQIMGLYPTGLQSFDLSYKDGDNTVTCAVNAQSIEDASTDENSPIRKYMTILGASTEEAIRSILPVKFSNFVYDVPVEGDEYTVTSIGDKEATAGAVSKVFNSSVEKITLPDTITKIDDYAFNSCSSLTSINLPEGLTTIGQSAFSGCDALSSINIPSTVTNIGRWAFSDCYSLVEIYNYSKSYNISVGSSDVNSDLGEYALVVYSPDALAINKPNTRIKILEGIQYYDDGEVFVAIGPTNRNTIATVKLDGRTTEIKKYAFYECPNLREVVTNEGLVKIGTYAFSVTMNKSSLASVVISSTVKTIGFAAFEDCENLRTLYIQSQDVANLITNIIGCAGYLTRYMQAGDKLHLKTGLTPGEYISGAYTKGETVTVDNVQYDVYTKIK